VFIAIVASLVAALCYAGASVLQHRAAVEVPVQHSLRLGLLAKLVAKPWWIAGIVADALGFAMQFIALGKGPIVVVQPLLVSGLLFALPFGAWVSGKRIHASELRAAGLVVAGLALMLAVANPSKGHATLADHQWVLLAICVLVPTAILILIAGRSRMRATLLAAAAASVYGITAALAKVTSHTLGQGIGHALASWQLWALIPGGLVGMLLCQSAFQAGSLAMSLPTLTAVDPLVSIAIGILAFHEHLDQHPLGVACEIAGTVTMVVGVFLLGRSPLVALDDPAEVLAEGKTEVSSDVAHHP
jgi:drug/metabolite transporter (DMT)-like permease